MKISLKWLKQFVEFDLSVEEFTDKITFAGIEVEEVIDSLATIKDIVVAKVIKAEQHPNADRLRVCTVFDGVAEYQVVCGAPNCRQGMLSAFAPVGSVIGEFKIKKAKLRGVESCGMLCSGKELCLNSDHSGIMELEQDAPLGKPLSELGYGDVVVDVEITPNRPDLLGMVGIARDVAAILGKPYTQPQSGGVSLTPGALPCDIKLINKEPDACPRFTLTQIDDLSVSSDMPSWMATALDANGMNKVNDLVGVTNYLLLEQGQPMHAYDLDKIEGGVVEVRFARQGESLEALNGKTYQLRSSDLVVADAVKILGIAGVIGGKSSAVDLNTKNILLEVANFSYPCVHKTSHFHKIFTDASYRYERGLSPKAIDFVLPRTAKMMAEVGKGNLQKEYADTKPQPAEDKVVGVRLSRVKRLLNVDIAQKSIISYLTALDLELVGQEQDLLSFRVPYFRQDIYREIDLIEEIIRLHGYNNVPSSGQKQVIGDSLKRQLKRKTEDFLVLQGFYQALNTSFVSEEQKTGLAEDKLAVELTNPLGAEMAQLRKELIPQLLKNMEYNLNKGQEAVKLFELNKVYFAREDGFADEPLQLAMVACGKADNLHWSVPERDYDIYDLKGVLEDYLAILGIEDYSFSYAAGQVLFDSTCDLELKVKGQQVALLGRVDRAIAKSFGIKKEVFALIFDFEKAFSLLAQKLFEFTALQKFPSVKRDLSIIVPQEHSYDSIKSKIKSSSKFLQTVRLYDKYTGKGIEVGKRSLTFALDFFSSEKTLTDDMAGKEFERIVKAMQSEFGAKLR